MDKDSRIFVAGHKGLVGSAIVRRLMVDGFTNIITRDRNQYDLTVQGDVIDLFHSERIEYVFLAAAKVGGIHANSTYPANFIRDNLLIQTNIIDACKIYNVKKLLFLGSSCIYPRDCAQPMNESELLNGRLEPTNEPYAIAKIAGIRMVQAYKKQYGLNGISLMPTNLYGPGDNFHYVNSHVLPAMIRKFHDAQTNNCPSVTLWGSGSPKREFLHVDDLADACIFLMDNYNDSEIINVGSGEEVTIAGLARTIANVVGYIGEAVWDSSKPDGAPRKLLDCSKIFGLGWRPKIRLRSGLLSTYDWFLKNAERRDI